MERKIPSPEQQKWVTKLLGFDFEITYKKGKENVLADVLSQLPEQAEVSALRILRWNGKKIQRLVRL